MRRFLFLLSLALVSGCFSRPKPACEFLCGPSNACPADYICSGDDNRCHLVDNGVIQQCTDMLPVPDASTPPKPDSVPPADAAPPIDDPGPIDAAIDAPPIDAPPIDAPIDAPPIDAPIDAPTPDSATP